MPEGGSQTYTITPATGYHVATLIVDGASVSPATSYTFTNVTAAHTISATFDLNTYTLTYTAGTGGTITGTTPQTVDHGADSSEVSPCPTPATPSRSGPTTS